MTDTIINDESNKNNDEGIKTQSTSPAQVVNNDGARANNFPVIIYHSLLDMGICKECKHGVRVDYVRTHMRKTHMCDKDALDTVMTNFDNRRKASTMATKHFAPLRAAWYKAAKIDEDLTGAHEALQNDDNKNSTDQENSKYLDQIEDLPIINALKCDGCQFLARSERIWRDHVNNSKDCTKYTTVPTQSILGGNKATLVQVTPIDRIIVNGPKITGNTTNIPTTQNPLKSTVLNLARLHDATTREQQQQQQTSAEKDTTLAHKEESYSDALIARFHIADHLKTHQLSLQAAHTLVSFNNQDDYHAFLDNSIIFRRCIHIYISYAFNLSRQAPSMMANSFLEKPLDPTISTDTKFNYETLATSLFNFLHRLSDPSSFVPNLSFDTKRLNIPQHIIRDAISTLLTFAKENVPASSPSSTTKNMPATSSFDESFLRTPIAQQVISLVHTIIKVILIEPNDNYNQDSVIPTFVACLSVKRHDDGIDHSSDNSNNKKNYSYSFKQSRFLSAPLAAIKYIIRCFAILHVYGNLHNGSASEGGIAPYQPTTSTSTSPTINTQTSSKSSRWNWLRSAVRRDVDSGCSYILYVLRTCHELAAYGDAPVIRFIKCRSHPLCGFIDGTEISLHTLGIAVRQMQQAAFRLLLDPEGVLLKNVTLPTQFWDSIDNMQDALRNRTPGFSYTSHPASRRFATLCIENCSQALAANLTASAGSQEVVAKLLSGEHNSILAEQRTSAISFAREYINASTNLQKLLLTCLHISSGGPARFTELATLRVYNTEQAVRNVFLLPDNMLATVTSYHKSRNMQGGKSRPILRVPDATTSALLHIYILIVRPLTVTMSQLVSTEYFRNKNYTDALFLTSPFNSSLKQAAFQLRTWFRSTLRAHNINLTPSQYRQFHAGAVKHLLQDSEIHSCISDIGDNSDDEDDVGTKRTHDGTTTGTTNNISNNVVTALHVQSAHTVNTANKTYGVSDLDMRSLNATDIEMFRFASEKWQLPLSLHHGPPSSSPLLPHNLDRRCSAAPSVPKSSIIISPTPSPPQSQETPSITSIQQSVNRMEQQIQLLQSIILQQNNQPHHKEGSPVTPVQDKRRKISSLDLQPSSEIVQINDNNNNITKAPNSRNTAEYGHSAYHIQKKVCLNALRTILDDPTATFRSEKLATSVIHAYKAEKDSLFVFPTGHGKSLIFLVPALLHKSRVSILIVPLVALQQDLIQRAEKIGLEPLSWTEALEQRVKKVHEDIESNRVPTNTSLADTILGKCRLLIISAEHTLNLEYVQLVTDLFNRNRLHAFYIDEAHIAISQNSFRPALTTMHKTVRPPALKESVPIFALTATAPPGIIQYIRAACGLSGNHNIIRMATSRPNISYKWFRIQDKLSIQTATIQSLTNCIKTFGAARYIVYFSTRNELKNVHKTYKDYIGNNDNSTVGPNGALVNVFTQFYHGKLDPDEQKETHYKWTMSESSLPTGANTSRVMFATSAFGCGIDTPNVRCVIHCGIPGSLLEYAQESGRAGRDMNPAYSIVLSDGDPHTWRTVSTMERTIFPETNSQEFPPGMPKTFPYGIFNIPSKSDTNCRRTTLESFVDGTRIASSTINCLNRKGVQLCNTCSSSSTDKSDHRHNTHKDTAHQQKAAVIDLTILDPPADQESNPIPSPTDSVINKFPVEIIPQHTLPEPSATYHPRDFDQPFIKRFAKIFSGCCTVCTLNQGKIIRHRSCPESAQHPSMADIHSQEQENDKCLSDRCFRCASPSHRYGDCPILDDAKHNNATGRCYKCLSRSHKDRFIHDRSEFGTRLCPFRILIRFGVLIFNNNTLFTSFKSFSPIAQTIYNESDMIRFLNGLTHYNQSMKHLTGYGVLIKWLLTYLNVKH